MSFYDTITLIGIVLLGIILIFLGLNSIPEHTPEK